MDPVEVEGGIDVDEDVTKTGPVLHVSSESGVDDPRPRQRAEGLTVALRGPQPAAGDLLESEVDAALRRNLERAAHLQPGLSIPPQLGP